MGQISQYVTAPYQGVSQAAQQVRLPEQATAIEDGFVAIPQGASKRPPLTHLGKLCGHTGTSTGIAQAISREDGADLLLTIEAISGNTVPRLYSLTDFPTSDYSPAGVSPLPLTISDDAQAYLNSYGPVPQRDLRVLTVADFTFITNTLNTVVDGTDTAPTRTKECLLWVKQASYGRTYTVVVTPVGGSASATVSLTTPLGSAASSAPFVDTDSIAEGILSGTYTTTDGASITGDLGMAGFTATRVGSVIHITKTAGDFTVEVTDGQGGVALIALKDKATNVSELPPRAVDGFTVRMTQNSAQEKDDFFLQFKATAGSNTGIWTESVAPGSNLGLDPLSMPVALTNDGSGWSLDIAPWKQRSVGDEELAPDPDFVGRTIQDMTFWRGRLAFISGEGCLLSNSQDPFQLYPTTLSSVIETDSIQLLSPYPDINNFRYGIPYDERLILFGDKAQCQITSDGVLSPDTARIDVMTTYEFTKAVRPQPSNGKLYFVAPKGASSSTIYEMAVDKVSNVTDAEDMTTAVPRYVPSTLDRSATCPVNYMILYGTSGAKHLYVHLFRYAEGQRVQNGWSRWNLPGPFVNGGMFFKNTQLFMVAVDGTDGHLVMLDTTPSLLDDDASAHILTMLDFRLKETQVCLTYDAEADQTLVTMPYAIGVDELLRVVARAPGGVGGPTLVHTGLNPAPEGFPADILWNLTPEDSTNEVILNGDWTQECPLWFGFQYTMDIELSRFYAKGQDNQPLRSGRLSIRRMAIDLADTGFLRVEVGATGRTTRSYTYTGYRYDDPLSVYNQPPNSTTVFRLPVGSENEQTTIHLKNDSHFQCNVLGFEWRGELNLKANRA